MHPNTGREGTSGKRARPVGLDVNKRNGEPRLRALVNTEPTPTHPTPTAPSLASAPFRPGELPLTAWIPLDSATRDLVRKRATEAALPIELWVRIAVEASRLAGEISYLAGCRREEVVVQLDLATTSPGETHTLAASELRRYAAELRKGHPAFEAGEVLALRLPEEISGAWNAAAVATRQELPHWLASMLDDAPRECVAWEATAAATCRSLGEWAYASWLRASTSAKA